MAFMIKWVGSDSLKIELRLSRARKGGTNVFEEDFFRLTAGILLFLNSALTNKYLTRLRGPSTD